MGDHGTVSPAHRRGLADEVADRVREAVLGGAYPPGSQLREVELAAALRVSRGPVREALRVLEREGLVHCEWHRGTTVTTFSPEDVAELDSLRGTLEGLAVRRVVELASDEEIAAIRRAADLTEHATDEHATVRLDIAFHDAVFAAAHHRRLEEAWEAIRGQVHLSLLTRTGRSGEAYLARVPAEHCQLVAALEARDTGRALDLVAAHRRHPVEVLTGSTDPA
ncbi:GntR family transcriptional regulator [Kitasatospora sp. NPDC127111]|uniref:GntR family transcriptional regulator n=1 Tax=Kitasatospora sp. NPDC127111 TaxID=3345363 RepID=UPI00362AFB89